MIAGRFFNNVAFRRYLELLGQLHDLIRSENDESAEGEQLRDQMDAPSDALDAEEIESVNGISADLYTLATTNAAQPLKPTDEIELTIRKALEARNERQFSEAIVLLRSAAPCIDAANLSYVRGSIMSEAGVPRLAADFFLHASTLSPSNLNFRFMWLAALAHSDPRAALTEARRILNAPEDFPAKIVFKAADIVFTATKELPVDPANAEIRRLIPVFDETIVRLQLNGDASEEPGLLAAAFTLLGFCHEHLQQNEVALRYFERGLLLFPGHDALHIAKGIQLYGVDTQQAVQSFSEAIRLQSRLVWPYFFLAHHNLCTERYRDCLSLAGEAFARAPSDAIRADCLEWMAICQAMLEHPAELVSAAFEKALQLSPGNARILHNQSLFDKQPSIGTTRNWQRLSQEELRSMGHNQFQPLAA